MLQLVLSLWLWQNKMKFCKVCNKDLPSSLFKIKGKVGTCIPCMKLRKSNYYFDNKEEISKKQSEYQKNSLKVKAYQAAYFQKNKEVNARATKKWRDNHPLQHQQITKQDYLKRKNSWPDYVATRRAKLLQAIPKWANKEKVKSIYLKAAQLTLETGIQHHVDHIVPLNSKLVCGLHWEGNLEPLPALENMLKGNRYETE
jgi:hypothetical protein